MAPSSLVLENAISRAHDTINNIPKKWNQWMDSLKHSHEIKARYIEVNEYKLATTPWFSSAYIANWKDRTISMPLGKVMMLSMITAMTYFHRIPPVSGHLNSDSSHFQK